MKKLMLIVGTWFTLTIIVPIFMSDPCSNAIAQYRTNGNYTFGIQMCVVASKTIFSLANWQFDLINKL